MTATTTPHMHMWLRRTFVATAMKVPYAQHNAHVKRSTVHMSSFLAFSYKSLGASDANLPRVYVDLGDNMDVVVGDDDDASGQASRLASSLQGGAFSVASYAVGAAVPISRDATKHLRALRIRQGDPFDICDGLGNVATCTLMHDDSANNKRRQQDTLAIVQQAPRHEPPPTPAWTLAVACGSLKGGRADWLVEKTAELGAATFAPVTCHRSSNVYDGRITRWKRLARAASEQSLRAHSLNFSDQPLDVRDLAALASSGKPVLVAAAGGERAVDIFRDEKYGGASEGVLVVGPEGDFTPDELNLLLQSGAQAVGLGPSRLRVESAAVALLSVARVFATS